MKNLYWVLSFNFGCPRLGLIDYVTRLLENKPKPKAAYKTGSGPTFARIYALKFLLDNSDEVGEVLAQWI